MPICIANEDVLTPAAAAARMGVTVETIERYFASGRLEFFRLPSGHRRTSLQAIERAIRHGEDEVAAEVSVVSAAERKRHKEVARILKQRWNIDVG